MTCACSRALFAQLIPCEKGGRKEVISKGRLFARENSMDVEVVEVVD